MRWCLMILIFSSLAAATPFAAAQDGAALAMSLRPNVVAVQAEWHDGTIKDGFGFVVGQRGRTAYVVTANHTLRGTTPSRGARLAKVRFFGLPVVETFRATILPLEANLIDLGVLTVEWPNDIAWNRAALAPSDQQLRFRDPVWFIGRETRWYVPSAPGTVNEVSPFRREINVDNLPVSIGTSGAPLLSSGGIVGMIVRDAAARNAIAVPISDIRNAIQEWMLPWQLVHTRPLPPPPPPPPVVAGDLAAGQRVFRQCQACHVLDAPQNRVGPHLVGIVGRRAGTATGFNYSPALADSRIVWDTVALARFLADPRGYIPGNRMAFAGLRHEQQIRDVIAYMRSKQ